MSPRTRQSWRHSTARGGPRQRQGPPARRRRRHQGPSQPAAPGRLLHWMRGAGPWLLSLSRPALPAAASPIRLSRQAGRPRGRARGVMQLRMRQRSGHAGRTETRASGIPGLPRTALAEGIVSWQGVAVARARSGDRCWRAARCGCARASRCRRAPRELARARNPDAALCTLQPNQLQCVPGAVGGAPVLLTHDDGLCGCRGPRRAGDRLAPARRDRGGSAGAPAPAESAAHGRDPPPAEHEVGIGFNPTAHA